MKKLRASDYAPVAHPFLTNKRSCFAFAQVPRVARSLLLLALCVVESGRIMAFQFPFLEPDHPLFRSASL